jgi:NADH-quinone oxidoreductase subunit M
VELILIPLLFALVQFFLKGRTATWAALVSTLVTLGITIGYITQYSMDGSMITLIDEAWIPWVGVRFTLAYDGISLMMVLLTNLALPFILLASWDRNYGQSPLYLGLVLIMQSALLGVFLAQDGILFYVFWELALIPIYFISAIWGGENKNRITLKFFIYTFFGSIFMLVGMILWMAYGNANNGFSWMSLVAAQLPKDIALYALLGFSLAFAIKMPLFPFHTWQPDTYTTAPAGGTMLLSGIMLKMGLFGFIKWALPLVPQVEADILHWLMLLAVIGIVYGSIIAIKQNDMKRLIAFSSMAHVGLIAAGIFTNSIEGIQGALIQMLNHGITVIGLFFVIDIIDRRMETRELTLLSGIAKKAPVFAVLTLIIVMGSVAVPLTNGFVGEFVLLKSIFDQNQVFGIVAGLTIIFCAVYLLRMFQFSLLGPESNHHDKFTPLTWAEGIGLGAICFFILWIGVNPDPFFGLTEKSVERTLTLFHSFNTIKP